MKTIKIGSDLQSQIWKLAKEYVGGFHMEVELGERLVGEDNYYFNRYHPEDDKSDLYSFEPLRPAEPIEVEVIPGKGVLLDYYVYNIERDGFRQLKDNLLIGLNEDGLIEKVWLTCTMDDHLVFEDKYPIPAYNIKCGVKSIDNLSFEHRQKIDDISDERRSGDGFWIYLKMEYADFQFDPWAPTRCIHEWTIKECVDRLKNDTRKITLKELEEYHNLNFISDGEKERLRKVLK